MIPPSQRVLRQALLDPACPAPMGLMGKNNAPAGKRFDVYRNNIMFSLTEGLRAGFPLVYKLIGAENFERLAHIFIRAHPPTSPVMTAYGTDLPAFLGGFAPLAHVGYLADAARLDLGLRASYHAADEHRALLTPSDLQAPDVGALCLDLAAPARIVRSSWPLFDIWQFNVKPNAPKPRAIAQDVLISRPEFDPEPHALPPGSADWIDALRSGDALDEAHDKTLKTHPDFDLGQALMVALTAQALVIRPKG
jgi:hypothetical protein